MRAKPRIAAIGECMVEFRQSEGGAFEAGFGGDTLNTAVYLSRLGHDVDYVTALGDDDWSEQMLALWRDEGVGTANVIRVPGRVPGLYVINVDERGERRFSYWRDSAPARDLFALPESAALTERLCGYDWLYLSGISLSLYGEADREDLFAALQRAKEKGARIAFDTNFRPRGWPDRAIARAAFTRAFALADILFASTEDLLLLFGDAVVPEEAGTTERVVKSDDLTVAITLADGEAVTVPGTPAERVVDTTAAGDSFAAAYLGARLYGLSPTEAAAAGHRLAGRVVQHRGALIPRGAMPER